VGIRTPDPLDAKDAELGSTTFSPASVPPARTHHFGAYLALMITDWVAPYRLSMHSDAPFEQQMSNTRS
jgi:hypothetical protein